MSESVGGYEAWHQLRAEVDEECADASAEWIFRRGELRSASWNSLHEMLSEYRNGGGLDAVADHLDEARVQCCTWCHEQCPGDFRAWLLAGCLCSDCEHVHETDHEAHAVAHGPEVMG